MNPQAHILKNNDLLGVVTVEVENFLRNNQGEYSSNEIFKNIPNRLQNNLIKIASIYTTGACSSPASYVGVVASMLCKNSLEFIHNYEGYCPILGKREDSFSCRRRR